VCQKKEMTKLWVGDKFHPVTVLSVVPQEVVRYKTVERDGYSAVVVGVNKSKKNEKISFSQEREFRIDEAFSEKYPVWSILTEGVCEGVESVQLTSISKGKGYQWGMKRFHLKGGPKTHGSKFHRQIGSMGNRKPRRTMKGHPHAGHMGSEKKTLSDISIVKVQKNGDESLLIVKWSVAGHYNSYIQVKVG